jgi:YidC/Oxa1 family membrane protein insertase
MSKNAPQAQKPSFWQNLLPIAILLIVFQMFMNTRNVAPDARTIDQILAAMRDRDAKVQDLSIARVDFTALQRRLSAENLTPDEQAEIKKTGKEGIEAQGAILVADTQLKAGLIRNDINRLNSAYTTLQGYELKWQNKPFWNNVVDVPLPEKGVVAEAMNPANPGHWTAQDLYAHTVSVLDTKNRETPVWGFFPGYQMIDFLVHATGAQPAFSYWFAAVLLAVALRAILFPLSQKQMMHSRQMQQLMPLIKEVQEKFKGNQVEIQTRTMEIYKEYGLNPMAGCLPMVIQMPLIFLIYQCMLRYRFEFQKGTFLWVSEAGHRILHVMPGLVAPNLGQKDFILLAIYGISMISTSLLMPVADPSNAKQQRLTSVGISAAFAVGMFFYPALPSGFVLYWSTMNILTTIQVILIYRTPMQPLVKVNTKDGGVYPKGGSNGSTNGKAPGPFGPTTITGGQIKTGTPAKHKPKKRK